MADRFFDSAENRKNLYAHYEEFAANDLDKAEKRNRKKHEGVARRKQEIKQRLAARKKEDKVSGVAIADRIAEAQISGVIYEQVTPEKGKQLSDSIKRKLLSQKQAVRS